MAKTLVLHIGDPKTGTSSIQEVLLHRLFDSPMCRLTYPNQLNCFPLANAISDPDQTSQRVARWGRTAAWLRDSKADVAVISAEQFFRVDPRALKATLEEFVPEYLEGLRIIAYVRPHAARLVSAYMQRTKAGLFLGDMDMFWRRSQRDGLLAYAPRFRYWRETFGEAFTLRPMIRSQLQGGDVVADFLGFALSGAPFTLKGAVEANTSLTLEHLAGLREVQAILKRREVSTGTRHAVGDHVNRSLSQLVPGQGRKLQMSLALYRVVRDACAEDAATLDREFFGGQPLMTRALTEAEAEALPRPQPALAKHHYSDDHLAALRICARSLVDLFKENDTAWTTAFEREIGQRPARAKEGAPTSPTQAHVMRVNEELAEIAALISVPSTARSNGHS